LGIDLVPFKTCSFDCGFCQVGGTTALTLDRREYVPTEAVIDELAAWFAAGGRADFLTLSGAGEPTLHSRFGDILRAVPSGRGMRTALLSNGSLFFLPEVRAAARAADVVKVSFGAWDAESFRRLNRPHPALRLEAIEAGIRQFRREFTGRLWVEVFLARGVNDAPDQVARIAEKVRAFAPDQIQLNTAVRPPTDPSIRAVDPETLAERARLFGPGEVVCAGAAPASDPAGRSAGEGDAAAGGDLAERIMSLIQRHPSTVDEVAGGLGVTPERAVQELDRLCAAGRVLAEERAGRRLWQAAPRAAG